jgi:hypothetical protein
LLLPFILYCKQNHTLRVTEDKEELGLDILNTENFFIKQYIKKKVLEVNQGLFLTPIRARKFIKAVSKSYQTSF